MSIAPLHRPDRIADGLSGQPPVRRGHHRLAGSRIGGEHQATGQETSSSPGGIAAQLAKYEIGHPLGQLISAGIVVAVTGAALQALAQGLVSLEVGC